MAGFGDLMNALEQLMGAVGIEFLQYGLRQFLDALYIKVSFNSANGFRNLRIFYARFRDIPGLSCAHINQTLLYRQV